jgi:acetyl esterase/lipase
MDRSILDTHSPPGAFQLHYGSDPLQFGDLRLPDGEGPHPVIVVLHGGCWQAEYDREYMGLLCAALTGAGAATWNVEYRRYGNSGGGWPGTFADVAMGTDFLEVIAPRHNLDLDRVIAIGHSAGGHLAQWLASRERIPPGDPLHTIAPLPLKGTVPLAGILDLRRARGLKVCDRAVEELMGGPPDRIPERYGTASPAELLPLGVPALLIHGLLDEIVPIALSQEYVATAIDEGDDARLVTLPEANHFEVVDPRWDQWPTIEESIMGMLR